MAKAVNDNFVKEIRKAMADNGVRYQQELAPLLLLSAAGLSYKMCNPGAFTLAEVRQLVKCLNFTDEAKIKLLE